MKNKKIHLICNSHIDPVWMWDKEEGLGSAVSTFYQAANFFDEYDYIFNHNESLLYEFIEQTDPALFARIQKLVGEEKWHIMGGWYLQPDCNLPCGESFVRQIKLGRKYFAEKFNARPTAAINFDAFGHSVGIVQILKKCGFDGYICCRPEPNTDAGRKLPAREFFWVGKDGSEIKVACAADDTNYTSDFGEALKDVKRKIAKCEDSEVGAVLWGVGNHGGNPSRKDLSDINRLIADTKDMDIAHSTPEAYFAELEPRVSYSESIQPYHIGAYTSMNSVKKKNIELENKLFTTEKLCSVAELNGLYIKNEEAFTAAEKALAFLQFHDTMAGTITSEGETSVLRQADFALELLQREYNKAYFALINRHKEAGEGEYPFFVVNTQPYQRDDIVEAEFLMLKPITNDEEQYTVTAWQDGKKIPCQCIKELSNINYDRRKRIAFRCSLKPLDITRIDFTVEKTPKAEKPVFAGDIIFEDNCKRVRISEKTGLIESYIVDGKELISSGAFAPVMYGDNGNPWGHDLIKLGSDPKDFKLSECKSAPFMDLKNVNIVESGEVLTVVESFFEYENSFVTLTYKLYKDTPYIDISADVLWCEEQKALKLRIPFAEKGDFIGQIPFAQDVFSQDGTEHPAHRFVGIRHGEKTLALYNNCTYGFSSDGSSLYATLLRGVAYVAHPIDDRPLIKEKRYIPYIEQGRHTFNFRLSYDDTRELENKAAEFLSGNYVINYFPHGEGNTALDTLTLDNKAISLAAFYKDGDGYVLRLINNNDERNAAKISLQGNSAELAFGSFEVKTLMCRNKKFAEKEVWI